jgi:hypothetical protein
MDQSQISIEVECCCFIAIVTICICIGLFVLNVLLLYCWGPTTQTIDTIGEDAIPPSHTMFQRTPTPNVNPVNVNPVNVNPVNVNPVNVNPVNDNLNPDNTNPVKTKITITIRRPKMKKFVRLTKQ